LIDPEEQLPVTFIKVAEVLGQDVPESDYVIDGVIDEKDLQRVLSDLSTQPFEPI